MRVANNLERLLEIGKTYFEQASISEITRKQLPKKWSKQEILGHLIDSAINNLKRFTEIQFVHKPYSVIGYNQIELVKANNYQNAKTKELIAFWLSINYRILSIIHQQTQETLNYEVKFEDKTTSNLKFLLEDYIKHLEHHINQITNENYGRSN